MERRYAKSHEWVLLEGDTGTVGISQYAVDQLGDVVYLELPDVGRSLNSGEPLGDIESVKAVSQVYAPIGGEIAEVNAELQTRPELVNESPLGEGWIVKIRLGGSSSLDQLMSQEEYDSFVAEQQ